MVTETQSLRPLIGGCYAVSWQGYLILLPISVLFIMFTTPAFGPANMWLEGVGVSLLAYGATGVVLLLAAVTVLRNRCISPVPIALVAAVGGLAWMVRSAVLYAYLNLRDLTSLAPLEQRLLYGLFLGAVSVPASAWLVASAVTFQRRRRELIEELVHEEITAQRLATYVEAMREGIVSGVQRAVSKSASSIDWSTLDATTTGGVQVLDRVSKEAARELAGDLWREARESSRLKLLALVRVAASSRPFAYWVVIPMIFLALPVGLRVWTLPVTLLVIGSTLAWMLLVAAVANLRAPRLHPRAAMASYITAIVAMALGAAFLADIIARSTNAYASGGENFPLLALFFCGIVFPLTGLLAGTGAAQRQVLDRLRDSISKEEVTRAALDREEARIRREIAAALHGTWSGNLTAVSMRLQKAIDDGDRDAATQALFEARRLVDIDVASATRRATADLPGIINTLTSSWEGLVTITADIDRAPATSPRMLQVIEDVVTEGINNAVRHADADRIAITIVEQDSNIEITIVDNGHPGSLPGSRGTGTRLLDSIAPQSWARTRNHAGGSTLTVRLPLAATLN